MQQYESFIELNDHHPEIYDYMTAIIDKSDLYEPISWVLGGDCFVIEDEEDYQEVKDQPWYDSAEEALPGWYLFFVANNNAGGPSWWVPAHMVQQSDIASKIDSIEGKL